MFLNSLFGVSLAPKVKVIGKTGDLGQAVIKSSIAAVPETDS